LQFDDTRNKNVDVLFIVLHPPNGSNSARSSVEYFENIEKRRDDGCNLATFEPDWMQQCPFARDRCPYKHELKKGEVKTYNSFRSSALIYFFESLELHSRDAALSSLTVADGMMMRK
jgi:hypothetical protein